MNFLKKNMLNIIFLIVAFIFIVIFDNEVETNDKVIEESFRWGRVIIIGLVVGCWNLLNHYFLKNYANDNLLGFYNYIG